ncbi:MAG: M1 family metallopeptidase [Ignavibacteriales bacterium]|nr:M1 family metallopeptidase [Ignavibacteriales bacterium]
MKKLLPLLLLFIYAGLSYLDSSTHNKKQANEKSVNQDVYQDGILKSELSNVSSVANYNIQVELFPETKKIIAEEELTWTNKTQFPANEIQLHLYPNAYKNRFTLFAKGRGIEINNETKSGVEISEIKIDDKPVKLIYIQPEVENKFDSTVAKIILNKPVQLGESLKINFKFSVPIPKAGKRFGYAADRNFFFISQWFPKVGVFENGKWICSQYHPFTNFFSAFGTYDVKIKIPEKFTVNATGVHKSTSKTKDGKLIYNFKQAGVHDFAWMASDEFVIQHLIYKRKDGSEIKIKAVILPENEKYRERFVRSVANALEYFEKYIGNYPYQTITIVDVPSTSQSGGMEYPTLITTGAELFSPMETLQPEYVTIHEFVHQFFYAVVANNEVYEAWLDEGLTSYIASKIVEKYYGLGSINFKFIGNYPILGLNFLSYNEIPLIYTLGKYTYPEGAAMLARYYSSPNSFSILDTSYKLPNTQLYAIASYSKPDLVLISLERYLGFNKMMDIFRDYYNQYKFRHPTSNNFLTTMQKNIPENLSWAFDNLFRNSSIFDYSVKYVKPTGNLDEHEVFIERIGDGIFPQEIALYTDRDTVYQNWDGKERWKKILFKTKNKVAGAEIDPYRKNILDLNYANNSYLINKQYGGSLRLSFRWFFWIQSLLIILSSVT